MKKKRGGGGANWMDTYGDMVTLLLCFFVLLYSMSTISEENWKALVMSFNPEAVQTPTQTSGNDGPNADPSEMDNPGEGMTIDQDAIDQDMEMLFQALKEYVSQEGMQNSISVTKGDGKIYVTFNQAVFFDGDDWNLREESIPILSTVGGMLTGAKNSISEVRVSGHTAQARDNQENKTLEDRQISAMRAATAVAYIQMNTELDAAKLISEGYGQWHPVADNETEEGKSQNRRVEMVISGRNLEAELEQGLLEYEVVKGE